MRNNRKPVYMNGVDGRRVISMPDGLWAPQKRISHNPGCKRGQRYVKYAGEAQGYREYDPDAKHSDPWESIHAPCEFNRAAVTAFGPKYNARD